MDLMKYPTGYLFIKCVGELNELMRTLSRSSTERRKLLVISKKPNIVPIYKKNIYIGNRQCPLNYNPVCVTTVVCKGSEKLIIKEWVDHSEKHDVLTDGQLGFQK